MFAASIVPPSARAAASARAGRRPSSRQMAARGQQHDGRVEVDVLHGRGHAAPRAAAGSRQLHDQRHLDGLAVEKDPVLVLAVVAEPLAVVRHSTIVAAS
jgi:hypothetical protein